jgi:hypothetical protein
VARVGLVLVGLGLVGLVLAVPVCGLVLAVPVIGVAREGRVNGVVREALEAPVGLVVPVKVGPVKVGPVKVGLVVRVRVDLVVPVTKAKAALAGMATSFRRGIRKPVAEELLLRPVAARFSCPSRVRPREGPVLVDRGARLRKRQRGVTSAPGQASSNLEAA